MKQFIITIGFVLLLTGCTSIKQASNEVGRTDEAYFTISDLRKKAPKVSQLEVERANSLQNQATQSNSRAGSYTNTYSNRLRNFGINRSFYYRPTPVIVPVVQYNPFTGWQASFAYNDPRFFGMNQFNSAFSPYYGYNMPFNDPFYSAGWGGYWMTGYTPFYTYNPYLMTGCGLNNFGFSPFYNYGFNQFGFNPYNNYYPYNQWNNQWNNQPNRRANSTPATYSRRTGTSNNIPAQNSHTNAPQYGNSPTNSGGGKWFQNNTGVGSGNSRSSAGSGSVGSGSSSPSPSRSDAGSSSRSNAGSSSSSGGSTRR